VKKFCSTRDLFSFILDPEFQYQIKEIYVHDMSQVPWDSPDDATLSMLVMLGMSLAPIKLAQWGEA